MTTSIESLRPFGFTEIEAEVYVALLRESPATGYRVSHAIGKPTPNTYKAIQSLQQRGAVIVDEGQRRTCRAVPPDELLALLERRFRGHKQRAARALAQVREETGDERVYQLKSVDSVWEKARSMLSEARVLVLLDVMPQAFAQLHDTLVETARRGVDVWAKVYARTDRADGVQTVLSDQAAQALAFWPGCQLSLVVDAESYLLALLSKDLEVTFQSIWSESVFLSCMHHNSVVAEILGAWATREGKPMSARRRARLTLGRPDLPGREHLLERCAQVSAEAG